MSKITSWAWKLRLPEELLQRILTCWTGQFFIRAVRLTLIQIRFQAYKTPKVEMCSSLAAYTCKSTYRKVLNSAQLDKTRAFVK